MKKIFTLAAFLFAAMSMQAKDYTGNLAISINGEDPIVQKSNISVDKQANGSYTILLKNFSLGNEAVGTIKVESVQAKSINGGAYALTFSGNNTILPNDNNGGMMANQNVPLDITGFINDYGFNTAITINLEEKVVTVLFTPDTLEGTQIPNSGFETFHTATHTYNKKSYQGTEPDHWHGFNSGLNTGSKYTAGLVDVALQGNQAHESNDTRPGSAGKKSLLIESRTVAGVSANGTITTGRLQAGSMTATNTANCSSMSTSDTNKDDHGDPFYATISAQPDAINVWLKYKMGKRTDKSKEYVYAKVSAIVTDGTKYQDPEDNDKYTNFAAKAADAIGDTNGEWKEFTIPFNYSDNKVTPKAILVTMSTCAQPGGGSNDDTNKDQLYIDDFSLVYNCDLKSLTFDGFNYTDRDVICTDKSVTADDFTVTSDGRGAYIYKEIVEGKDNTKILLISIAANDFSDMNRYAYTIKPATGVSETFTTQDYGYATYCPGINVKFPTEDGIKAYNVTYENGAVATSEINGTVAAGTPLLLRAEYKGAKEYKLNGSGEKPENIVSGMTVSEGESEDTGDGSTIYVLSNGKSGIGFYRLKNGIQIPKDKCYLIVVSSGTNAATFYSLGDPTGSTTAIDRIENAGNVHAKEAIYNLAGQKVNAQYKGIVIKNGKKMVIK